jgi:hypothetical protein
MTYGSEEGVAGQLRKDGIVSQWYDRYPLCRRVRVLCSISGSDGNILYILFHQHTYKQIRMDEMCQEKGASSFIKYPGRRYLLQHYTTVRAASIPGRRSLCHSSAAW